MVYHGLWIRKKHQLHKSTGYPFLKKNMTFLVGGFQLKKMQPSNWIISGPGWKQKIDKNHHQIKIYNSQNPTKHKKRSRFLRFFSSKSKVLVSANLEYFTSLVMLVISSWVGK